MPVCCIVMCGSRRDKNQPTLSLHRFPRNESLRKQWIQAIGEESINPRHKEWYLCSLHFEENCFNRTLDVIRLHENSVPTLFLAAKTKKLPDLCETGNIKKSGVPRMPAVLPSLQFSHQSLHEKASNTKKSSVLSHTGNIEKTNVPSMPTMLPSLQLSNQSVLEMLVQEDKVKVLKEKFAKQRLKTKRLSEKIRRQNKTIANLKDILEELRRRNQINMEQTILIEDLAEPQDLLKRQINKYKGLPTQNKHSKERRKKGIGNCTPLEQINILT